MRIVEVTLENFKIFKGKFVFPINSNFVFLVGENNTGKSSLMEAINFLKLGLPPTKSFTDLKNKYSLESEHVKVTVKFQGNIKGVINIFSEKKYEKYVYEEEGVETILAQRSSENKPIKQNGKDVELSLKTITLWNSETNQFENPSGIDTVFKTLFETQFVWADTNPDDIADFGSTKICGSLLKNSIGDFFETDKWKQFERVHKETFCQGDDCLNKKIETLEEKIKVLLLNQYGQANIKFNFSLPDTSTFYKSGKILVDEVPLKETGSGLQRAIALTIIQIYAEDLIYSKENPDATKPLFFFIDEPEICLHPKAQKLLLAALTEISKHQQIFVTTHSPYLLKEYRSDKHNLFVFNKQGDTISITPSIAINLFRWSPSWGEINYLAYGMPTMEFHDELYGSLHESFIFKAQDEVEAKRRSYIGVFDTEVLAGNNALKKIKKWSELKNGTQQTPYPVTLSTFIRNKVHHPESTQLDVYTDIELTESIEEMIELTKQP